MAGDVWFALWGGWAGLNVLCPGNVIAQLGPPIVEHPVNPDWRTVETTYLCNGNVRRFSVRYTNTGFEFLGGTRKGVPISREDTARVTQALRRLDAVSTIIPQCAPSYDFILVLGLRQERRTSFYMSWREDRLWISEPEPYSS